MGGINPSAGIDLNLYNNVNQTGYDTNGNIGSPTTINNVNLHSGDPVNVSVTYNSQSQVMAWTLTDTVASTTFSTSQSGVNLQSVLSGSSAFIGFSGGDGGAVSTQKISNFTYTPAVPANNILPTSTALLVNGSGTLDLYGVSQTIGSLTGTGTVTNSYAGLASTLTVGSGGASGTFAGTIANGAGLLSLTKTGTGTLGLTGNVSLAGTLTTGGGALSQTAGSVQAPTVVVDGGTYNLSGNGKLLWSGNLIVGNSGTGTFNQSGGTNSSLAGVLDLGNSAGAMGTYNMSGPALLSVQDEGVGVGGQGSFVQTGGTNSSAILISNSGSYTISGGLLREHRRRGDFCPRQFVSTIGRNGQCFFQWFSDALDLGRVWSFRIGTTFFKVRIDRPGRQRRLYPIRRNEFSDGRKFRLSGFDSRL